MEPPYTIIDYVGNDIRVCFTKYHIMKSHNDEYYVNASYGESLFDSSYEQDNGLSFRLSKLPFRYTRGKFRASSKSTTDRQIEGHYGYKKFHDEVLVNYNKDFKSLSIRIIV